MAPTKGSILSTVSSIRSASDAGSSRAGETMLSNRRRKSFPAKALFNDAVEKHGAEPGPLTLNTDRGGPMKAKATALQLADLGVTKSHSRHYTSNDNPFSESCFKTLNTSRSSQTLRLYRGCKDLHAPFFFGWNNRDHHHIPVITPRRLAFSPLPTREAPGDVILPHCS
ncbi:MAG: transposase [Methylocystaceae bacterium]|nr:MAG: transposase [Methylocystaceae bacterium]